MQYIVTKSIPKDELKDHKDYIGFLFKNENGVYNICKSEEDVIMSNKWFKNLPLNAIIVSDEQVVIGDVFLATAPNRELHGKTFKFLGYTENAIDLIDVQDNNGNKITSTKFLLEGAFKFIRVANTEDKKQLVNGVISEMGI